jgi:hypothetical protein
LPKTEKEAQNKAIIPDTKDMYRSLEKGILGQKSVTLPL